MSLNLTVITPPPVEPVTDAEAFVQLKLIVDPATNISTHPQLAEVQRQIKVAREQVEKDTKRAIVQQTILLTMGPPRRPEWGRSWDWVMRSAFGQPWGVIELPRPPFIRIVAVRYYDETNTLIELDDGVDTNGDPDPAETLYYFTTGGPLAQLRFIEAFPAPAVYLRDDAIQVEYVAGYPPLVTPAVEAVDAVEADPDADPPVEAVEAVEAVDEIIDYRANVPASIKQAILLGVQMQADNLTPQQRDAYELARKSLLSSLVVTTL